MAFAAFPYTLKSRSVPDTRHLLLVADPRGDGSED